MIGRRLDPEPDYNDSLVDIDHDLVGAFEPSASGITVLVETFGGRRNYYIYVSADAPVEDMKRRLSSTRYTYFMAFASLSIASCTCL